MTAFGRPSLESHLRVSFHQISYFFGRKTSGRWLVALVTTEPLLTLALVELKCRVPSTKFISSCGERRNTTRSTQHSRRFYFQAFFFYEAHRICYEPLKEVLERSWSDVSVEFCAILKTRNEVRRNETEGAKMCGDNGIVALWISFNNKFCKRIISLPVPPCSMKKTLIIPKEFIVNLVAFIIPETRKERREKRMRQKLWLMNATLKRTIWRLLDSAPRGIRMLQKKR